MKDLTRRQALLMGLIPLATFVMTRTVGRVLPVGDGFTRGSAGSLDVFRELFTDLGSPRDIGRRYLESFSQETDRAFLERAITGGKQPEGVTQLRTLLAQKREDDFRAGNIAIVDGWVLSRTEARACALTVLL